MIRVGVHCSTKGDTQRNREVAQALGAELFVWMVGAHDPGNMNEWPHATHILRLPNASCQPRESVGDYAARLHDAMYRWSSVADTLHLDFWFQMGNEPDIEGYDLNPPWGVDGWKQVAGQYLAGLRHNFPDHRFLSTPFSVENTRYSDAEYQKPFDGVAVHQYWAAEQGTQFGAMSWDGHSPIYFTELNSNPTDPHQIFEFLSHSIGDGAAIFMADAPDDFAHYDLSPFDAGVIRALLTEPPAPPSPPTISPAWNPDAPVQERMDDLKNLICEAADRAGVPRDIAAGLVEQESGGYIGAYNAADGGSGLTQITPPYHPDVDYARCRQDPKYALDNGFKILANNHQLASAWAQALTAYNGDPTGHRYADSVLALAKKYAGWLAHDVGWGKVLPERVVAEAVSHLGEVEFEGHPAWLYCEAFVEWVHERLGLTRIRFASAATHAATLAASGSLRTDITPPPGSVVFWDERFYKDGHTAIALGGGRYIGTTTNGIQIGEGWESADGYVGWFFYPGVAEGDDMALPTDGKADDGLYEYLWRSTQIALNKESGFYRRWLELVKAGVPIGLPCVAEFGFPDGRTCQGYTSGAVMTYVDGAVYVN